MLLKTGVLFMTINTEPTGDQLENQEEVIDLSPSLTLDIKDEELVSTINRLVSEAETGRNEMIDKGELNEKYWKGNQLDETQLKDFQARIVDNRLFLSLETIIPIMTSRTPEPTIRMAAGELRENTKQLLMNLWDVPTDDCSTKGMQADFEQCSRHWSLYRIGALKYEYDPEINDIRTRVVRPQRLIFDKEGTTIDDSRFVAEYIEDTVEGLINKFPSKKSKILEKVGDKEHNLSKIRYLEFWTDDYVCYKYQDIILEKKKNPNWDYGDMGGEGTPKFNLFVKARKPYILLQVFNLGKQIYDDTSLFEQAISLQDGLNKQKRQVSDITSDTGVLVGSGDFIEKKVLEAYTGDPKEKLFLKSGDARAALSRLEAKDLPPGIFNDINDTKSEIDNIFGSHSTTRGERAEPKTLGEAQLLRTGDLGRIDLFSRALDRMAQEWFTSMLHMYLVFMTEPKTVNSNDEDGTEIIFDRTKFIGQDGKLVKIKIKVKPGSAMSIDKDARRAEAIQLASAKLIDPITLFERLDYSNPREMAMKLFQWMTNPLDLFPELKAQVVAQQQAQQQAETEMAANAPLPEGQPINIPTNLTAPSGVQ